jgi:N-ethylmaleimide reductase
VIEIAGAGRTGVRLTPNGTDQGVRDSNPEPVFVAAARTLSALGVAHLELREPPMNGTFGASDRPPDYGLDRAAAAISSEEAQPSPSADRSSPIRICRSVLAQALP